MRTVLFGMLQAAILVGCGDGTGAPVAPKPPAPNTPADVLRLADEYVASHSPTPAEAGRDLRDEYCRSFFEGLISSGADTYGGTEAMQRGFAAGQERRSAEPAKVEETMKGFGYTEVEVEGEWVTNFEHSCFSPESDPQQRWWLWGLGKVKVSVSKPKDEFGASVRVRVRGYLSPSGVYGHLGGYERLILAMSIVEIRDSAP